jgi:hypothetical protein
MLKFLLAVALCSLLFSRLAMANDAVVAGVGGAPSVIKLAQKEHPSIRLVREDVFIKLPKGEVTARFVFRNEGPETTVLMGFPEKGGGDTSVTWSNFDYFVSFVDGRRVKVQRFGPKGEIVGDYEIWWVKRVHFRKGQTRIVVNRYRGGFGYNTSGMQWFTYVLSTGASWKGTIGYARIVCDISGMKGDTVWADPHKRVGHLLIWEFRNFEPKTDIEIQWWGGFWDFEINGYSIKPWECWEGEYYVWKNGSSSPEPVNPPEKRGNDIRLQLTTAVRWLGLRLRMLREEKPYRVRLEAPSGWIELEQGSRWALTPKGRRRLPEPVRLKNDHLVTYLRPIVEALGGTMRWDRHKRKFIITMPYKLFTLSRAR